MWYLLASRGPQSPTEWVILGGILVVGLLLWWFFDTREKNRRAEIGEKLRALGFTHDGAGCSPDAPELEFFRGNPLLKYERNAVKWLATGDLAGRFVRVLEYRYTTGYGKSTTHHDMTIAATDLPIHTGWLVLERKRWFTHHTPSEKPRTLPESAGALCQTFRSFYDDDRVVPVILTARVQAILEAWSKKNWLQYRDGMLLLGVRDRANAEQVRQQLDALIEIASAIDGGSGAQT